MVKRECKFCEKTTSRPLSEFYEIGWNAVSFDNKKSICSCPFHSKLLMDFIAEKDKLNPVKE